MATETEKILAEHYIKAAVEYALDKGISAADVNASYDKTIDEWEARQ
jgi:hypothetical protein